MTNAELYELLNARLTLLEKNVTKHREQNLVDITNIKAKLAGFTLLVSTIVGLIISIVTEYFKNNH